MLAVDVIVRVFQVALLLLQPKARGVVVAHQDDVEVLADELQCPLRVVSVASDVTKQDELAAVRLARVGERRLQRLRVRMCVAHDRVFHPRSPCGSIPQFR